MLKDKIFAVIFFILFTVMNLSAKEQGWLNNSLSLKIIENLKLKASQESRFPKVTYFGNRVLNNIVIGLGFKLPLNFNAGLSYKLENEIKSSTISDENRYIFDTGWKWKIAGELSMDNRLRIESRNYRESEFKDHWRYRFRLRFKFKIEINEDLAFIPFIGSEPFADSISREVYRNRFYLGTEVSVSKNVKFIANYMRQDTKGKDPVDALNSGIDLSF